MKFFWALILLLLFQQFQAQNLSAKVVDENNKPLVGATVYFDGTTSGVITNRDGIFSIEKPESISEPLLVITYLGYETLYEANNHYLKKVYQLKLRAENLDIVDLYDSPFSRKDMLEVFKDNFLGKGKPAKKCEILNIDDVIVYYVVKENTLYATSVKPIIIQNNYLGYKIKFDLEGFKVNFNTKSLDKIHQRQSYYAGFSFFEDINPKNINRRQKIHQRSLSKFFKSLVEGNLDNTKFQVGYKGFIVSPDKVFEVKPLEKNIFQVYLKSNVIKTFNGKYIPSKITLKYNSDLSTLHFQKPHCRVSRFGNIIDIQNVLLIGELSESKVAKMLPVNFSEYSE